MEIQYITTDDQISPMELLKYLEEGYELCTHIIDRSKTDNLFPALSAEIPELTKLLGDYQTLIKAINVDEASDEDPHPHLELSFGGGIYTVFLAVPNMVPFGKVVISKKDVVKYLNRLHKTFYGHGGGGLISQYNP